MVMNNVVDELCVYGEGETTPGPSTTMYPFGDQVVWLKLKLGLLGDIQSYHGYEEKYREEMVWDKPYLVTHLFARI